MVRKKKPANGREVRRRRTDPNRADIRKSIPSISPVPARRSLITGSPLGAVSGNWKKLAPIRPTYERDNSDFALPPSHLQELLKKGCGIAKPLYSFEDLTEQQRSFEHRLSFQDLLLSEYELTDVDIYPGPEKKDIIRRTSRTFVMQTPANENTAVLTRKAAHGEELTYRIDIAQAPKQGRACGNGPKCEY